MNSIFNILPNEKTKGLFIAAYIEDAINRTHNMTKFEQSVLAFKAHWLAKEVQLNDLADAKSICDDFGITEFANRALSFINMLYVTNGRFSEDDTGCQLYKKLIQDQIAEELANE